MITQLEQQLTDTEAKTLRAGILKSAKAIDPLETINALGNNPEAQSRGLTCGCAKYWLSPFSPNKKQNSLKGLSKIQAYVALTLLSRSVDELERLGPFNEPHIEMPASWQTQQVVRAAHVIRTNDTEILSWCHARIHETQPLDLYEGYVGLLRETNFPDEKFILLKEVVLGLADRAMLQPVKHGHGPEAVIHNHAEELAGNASSALSRAVNNPDATLELAPFMFSGVKEIFEQPLLKALAARKLH